MRDLRQKRIEKHRRLERLQEEIHKLSVETLSEIVRVTMPEAKEISLAATPTHEHWTEAILAINSIRDSDGNEIDWERILGQGDKALISELQIDLTEHYAIPQDAVSLTIVL